MSLLKHCMYVCMHLWCTHVLMHVYGMRSAVDRT